MDSVYDALKARGQPLSSFKKGDTIHVNNKMQKGYSYILEEDPGTNFHPDRRHTKKQQQAFDHSILYDSQNVKVEDYD